jgi:hypothetical protein
VTEAERLVHDLQRRQVRLWLERDEIRFRAPRGALTTSDKEALRRCRDEVHAALVAQQRRVAHLRAAPIATLIGRLAAAGIWLQVVGDRAEVRTHDDADLTVLDDALIEALGSREAEAVTFLRRPADDLSPAERRSLGYTATGPLEPQALPPEEDPS